MSWDGIVESHDRASGHTYIGYLKLLHSLGGAQMQRSELWATGDIICATNRIHNVCQLPFEVSIASTITALR